MTRRHLMVPYVAGVAAASGAFAIASSLTASTSPPGSSSLSSSSHVGQHVFGRMGCGSCHQLAAAGSQGGVGPSLDERLPAHSAHSLRAAIVSPRPTSMMPDDFETRMTRRELDALVGFLLATRE